MDISIFYNIHTECETEQERRQLYQGAVVCVKAAVPQPLPRAHGSLLGRWSSECRPVRRGPEDKTPT